MAWQGNADADDLLSENTIRMERFSGTHERFPLRGADCGGGQRFPDSAVSFEYEILPIVRKRERELEHTRAGAPAHIGARIRESTGTHTSTRAPRRT